MSSYPTALQNRTLIHRVDAAADDAPLCFERTDNQLVELVLAGDGSAFEHIFDRHKRLVAIVASRYFRRPQEIEEIIQITFAKVFIELDSFRGNFDRSLSSWLVKIASNACLDALRRQKRKPERLDCDLTDAEKNALVGLTAVDPFDAEKSLLDRDLTEKLLAAIPVDDRILLQMLYAEEMSVVEIAEVFEWSTANVKGPGLACTGGFAKDAAKVYVTGRSGEASF